MFSDLAVLMFSCVMINNILLIQYLGNCPGMQELWGGEDSILNFYSHSCPRLYELNTVAYWIMEKKAHSPRLRAQINQIAQVVIELEIKRGTTSLAILKAEKRDLEDFHQPHNYWKRET